MTNIIIWKLRLNNQAFDYTHWKIYYAELTCLNLNNKLTLFWETLWNYLKKYIILNGINCWMFLSVKLKQWRWISGRQILAHHYPWLKTRNKNAAKVHFGLSSSICIENSLWFVNSHKQRTHAQNSRNRFRLQGVFTQAHLYGMLRSEKYFKYKVFHFNNNNVLRKS